LSAPTDMTGQASRLCPTPLNLHNCTQSNQSDSDRQVFTRKDYVMPSFVYGHLLARQLQKSWTELGLLLCGFGTERRKEFFLVSTMVVNLPEIHYLKKISRVQDLCLFSALSTCATRCVYIFSGLPSRILTYTVLKGHGLLFVLVSFFWLRAR